MERVKCLLQRGFDANQPAGEKLTFPLMTACYLADPETRMAMFELLLKYGAEAKVTDICGKSSLTYARSRGHEEELDLILKKTECNFNSTDHQGNNLLHCNTDTGNLTKVFNTTAQREDRMSISTRNIGDQTPPTELSAEKLRQESGTSTLPRITITEAVTPPPPKKAAKRCEEKKWVTLKRTSANLNRSSTIPHHKIRLPPIAEEGVTNSGTDNLPPPPPPPLPPPPLLPPISSSHNSRTLSSIPEED